MSCTVTTSTVAILTSAALAGSGILTGILVLLALLVGKELSCAACGAACGGHFRKLGQVLDIGILPLAIAFTWAVIVGVTEVLR
jgi:hypothetical protein